MVDKPASGVSWSRISKNADGSFGFTTFVPFEKADSEGDTVRVSGVAYPHRPGQPDHQGDWATAKDVKDMKDTHDAAGRKLNVMHAGPDLTPDQAEVTDSRITPAGHWSLSAVVKDPQLVDRIRKGELGAWSIEGICRAGKAEEDEDEGAPMTEEELQELAEIEELTKQAGELVGILKALDDAPAPVDTFKAAREELEAAQKARSAKYGIPVLQGGRLTPPKGFPTDPEEYADPVNYAYPLHDAAHAANAHARFAQHGKAYGSAAPKVLARIQAAEKKHGVAAASSNNVAKGIADWAERVDAFLDSGQLEMIEKAVLDETFADTCREQITNILKAVNLAQAVTAATALMRALDQWEKHREPDQNE